MNDADLEKLTVKPGKLEPEFKRWTEKYSMLLPSSVTNLNISPVTRDADASWTIVGVGNIRDIPITPGETRNIKIEVTAEDGTTKEYNINIVSMSPSAAVLSDIKLPYGSLSPEFKSDCYEYVASLPWFLESVTILPEAKDKDTEGANAGVSVLLFYGQTQKTIEVVSPDKTTTTKYNVQFRKTRILRAIVTTDCDAKILKRCPVCLGILQCPVSLKQQETEATSSKKLLFCRSCAETLTRTRKQDPFTEKPLPPDFIEDQNEHEKILAPIQVLCCYYRFGCEEKIELRRLGKHLKECSFQPTLALKFEGAITAAQQANEENLKTDICKMCSHSVRNNEFNSHLKFYCPAKHPNTRFTHVVELRKWEKKLNDKSIQRTNDLDDFKEDAPLDKMGQEELEIAAQNYARLIKMQPRDHVYHFKLATVLEEMYYAQDMFGIKKEQEGGEENEDKDFDNLMDIASDSSKEDDIKALCEQRGVSRNAPLSLVLKAIDEEYHSLLDQNQSAKADYVQKLYNWKSKQSVQQRVGNLGSNEKDGGLLNKALLKCQDALACDPNNSRLHMHVGRYLLMLGRYEDAVKRLEAAFGLRPTGIQAKFYLGLAYMKHFARAHRHQYDTLQYLQDGIDYALYKMVEDPDPQSNLCSTDIFVRDSNVLILEGMLELGNVLVEKGYSTEMERLNIIGTFEQTSTICFQVMSNIVHRNQIYQQLKWISLRAHLSLGLFLMTEMLIRKTSAEERRQMQEYWDRLAALSRAFELPRDNIILDVQRQIGEEAVALMPSSSKALYHLGDIQLALFDHDAQGNKEYLKEAENSYRASIYFEGKDSKSRDVASQTQESTWWKERQIREHKFQVQHPKLAASTQLKSALSSSTMHPKTAGSSTAVHPKTSDTSAAAKVASKAPTAQKAPAKATVTSPTKPPKAPTTTRRTPTAPKGKTPAKTTQNSSATKPSNTPSAKKSDQSLANKSSGHSSTACAASKEVPAKKPAATAVTMPVKPPEKPKEKATPAPKEEVIRNRASFQARLGLARTLTRTQKDSRWAEITELYYTVISIAPHVHDAYIELGDMLAKTDPQQAIEVYSKYPFGKELSFDDAYLHGEIIRLIMKTESYDDPILEKSLIAYGTVMGFSALEKHVSVLENKFKFGLLKNVYAGVNKKDINDEELQQFFKFKLWV